MKRLLKRLTWGLFLCLLAPGLALAQEGTVEGTVTDAGTGDPLPGATVQIVNTNLGAATDAEGQYTIPSVPAGNQRIQVSFVGYETVTRQIQVQANQTATANFEVAPSTAELDEVVITGYRAERKRVETGSSVSVSAQEIEGVTVRSPDAALQGRAAGVRVTSASGQPGAAVQVNVRGTGSITAGSDPLYIIDGVQVSNNNELSLASGNPLSAISPNDIASIEVLKDASAKSIYGAQAANGVVIITTKGGRRGATEVSFSTQIGSVDRIKTFDVLNAEQYLDYRARALDNTAPSIPLEQARQFANQFWGPDSIDTNWQDQVFRNGLTQSYNMSLRGGGEKTSFFVSGRFTRDEGQIIDSQLKQGGLRANIDHQVNDKLRFGTKFSATTTRLNGTISDGPFINSPFWSAQFIPATSPVFNIPGDPSSGFNLSPDGTFSFNPVAQEEFNTRESSTNQIIASASMNYSITDNLIARSFAGINHLDSQEEDLDDSRLPANQGVGGSLGVFADRTTNFNISQTFTYSNVFNDVHSVSALAGAEHRQEDQDDFSTRGEGFPNFLFRTLASAANPVNSFSARTEFRQSSFFGDVEYTYNNTYQIKGTLRYDGSSRFGEDNRWGLFGTVGGFYRISNAAFLEDVDALNNLLIRAGWGLTGNSSIGNFASRRLFGSGGEYAGGAGIGPSSLGNNLLTWEENQEINLGLDYSVFGGRLSGSVDAYRSDRQELLLNRDLPNDSGFGGITENIGEVRAQGLEFAVETVNVDAGSFVWRTNFNIAFQSTEVRELLRDDNEIVAGGVYRVGEEINQFEFTRWAGVNPANGRPMYLDLNGNLTYVGDDADDEVLMGNTEPTHFGGLGNTFSYKGLTLDVFFQFDYGRETLNNNAFFADVGYFPWNKDDDILDFWREPGDITEVPKPFGSLLLSGGTVFPDGTTEGVFTQRFMEDASYIRLKQVKLSYQVPQSLLTRIGLRRASLFVQGENLATWTEFTGPDPEIIGTGLGEFPQSRRITGGLNLTL